MTSMHETPDSHEQVPFSPVPLPETPASVAAPMMSDPELRHHRIAEAAYFWRNRKDSRPTRRKPVGSPPNRT